MHNSSNPLSVSLDRPLDPLTLATLRLLDGLLRRNGIPYMLVGATARDLLLYHVFGHAIVRGTHDLDFAILLDSWDQFQSVKKLLLAIEGVKEGRQPHRFEYRPATAQFVIVIDIIPFGGLESANHTIAWPPDADVVMNVAAFPDVFASSVVIEIKSDLRIPTPSLAGLIILKLFAWLDRRDARDVSDIRRILETYTDAGNVDRLYEEEAEELTQVDFDTRLAGAYLLGKDAKLVVTPEILGRLSAALSGKVIAELIQEVAHSMSALEDRTEPSGALVGGFFRGMGIDHLR
jgi:predicted nucleotidyltransferase